MGTHDISATPEEAPLGHHCGVAGVFAAGGVDAPRRLFYMLFSLQHRGQESCGIAWDRDGAIAVEKGLGMVASILPRFLKEDIVSKAGIGHVRYSTQGSSCVQNAQPIAVDCNKGSIALAHNGNISNGKAVRDGLVAGGSIFQGSTDSELFLHLLSRSTGRTRREILSEACAPLEGAYSLAVLWNGCLVALRDPKGFRPLYLGVDASGVVHIASETCALQVLGPMEIREVAPGECLVASDDGIESFFPFKKDSLSCCVFELIYFARPDSTIFGHSVHVFRKRLGEALAEGDAVRADIVIPVPDSGTAAALGYSRRAGLPFDFGLSRNHYAGRSFILPTKGQRELAVRMKLHAVREVVEGKRVVMIDDSLVRGTTSRIIVRLLKEAGAKEVHVRLSSPEIRWPCYYGIDIPTREELISNRLGTEEIAAHVGADSVGFLSIDKLRSCLDDPEGYCAACFDGRYPCPLRAAED